MDEEKSKESVTYVTAGQAIAWIIITALLIWTANYKTDRLEKEVTDIKQRLERLEK